VVLSALVNTGTDRLLGWLAEPAVLQPPALG
jgi:hypothetical protein